MSKHLIKLGRDNEPKVIDLVPEETCVFYSIISEYYDGSDDTGYIIKIPDFNIEDIKKFIRDGNIEDGVIRFCICHASALETEMCLGAYDDLINYFVEQIKNS